MTMFNAFFSGLFLALGLIVPLGVQNIFIFNQGANQEHFLHALPSVITAIICDVILILSAILGVSLLVLQIPWLKTLIYIFGAIFLLIMGFVTWNTKPMRFQAGMKPLCARRQIVFAASVSLLNPHALIDTIAVIGVNALHFFGREKLAYTLGCVLVSCLWFFGLSVAGHFLHRLDSSGRYLRIVNKISALVIWTVGIYIIGLIFGWY